MKQVKIPAVYMRGGTSKGIFFLAENLPADPVVRDRVLLRVVGSPDPYGKHIDGMGGATSSTSKVVILSRSSRPGFDVDYLFGAVSVTSPVIDWSGNCGNLSAAVAPFAIHAGLVQVENDGVATVKIWQANIGKCIIAKVPIQDGVVQELGDFELDGVAFPAAEVELAFLDPASDESESNVRAMFPSGQRVDRLQIPGYGDFDVTLINAGNPTIFVNADSLGLKGTELQADINGNKQILQLAETIRAYGAVAMGLVGTPEEATTRRPHTPKLAFVAPPLSYVASDGRAVTPADIDMSVRIFSMGQLHHAMTGTGAVAIAAAAAIPDTIVSRIATIGADGRVCFGHPSGALCVGAKAQEQAGQWVVRQVVMSRSARRLMEGSVLVPEHIMLPDGSSSSKAAC